MTPAHLAPFEELGSGVRNLFKYARAFGGQDPILSEDSIFRVTLMLPQHATGAGSFQTLTGTGAGSQLEPGEESRVELGAESGAESQERRVLAALTGEPLSKAELASRLGLPAVSGALNRSVRRLLDGQLISYTQPDKPNSRLQKYRLTAAGQAYLNRQGA